MAGELIGDALESVPAYARLRQAGPARLEAVYQHHLSFLGGLSCVVAVSPDGKLLATASQYGPTKGVQAWDIATGRLVWETRVMASALAFTRDGRAVLASVQGSLAAFSAGDGTKLAETGRLDVAPRYIAATWSSRGAVAWSEWYGADQPGLPLVTWDLDGGATRVVRLSGAWAAVAPDEDFILSVGERVLVCYGLTDLETRWKVHFPPRRQLSRVVVGAGGRIYVVNRVPESTQDVVDVLDRRGRPIASLTVSAPGEHVELRAAEATRLLVAVAPDHSTSPPRLETWDVAARSRLSADAGYTFGALSADGSVLALTGYDRARAVDLARGDVLFEGPTVRHRVDAVSACDRGAAWLAGSELRCVHGSGAATTVASHLERARTSEDVTYTVRRVTEHAYTIERPARHQLLARGDTIWVVRRGGATQLDLEGTPLRRHGPRPDPTALAVDPAGRCVALAVMGRIGLFDPERDRLIRVLQGHREAKSTLVADEELRGRLATVSLFVRCVDFSTDGKRLVSASEDHTIRVWDVDTGETLSMVETTIEPDDAFFTAGDAGVLFAGWQGLAFWEIGAAAPRWTSMLQGGVRCTAISDDRTTAFLALNGGHARIIDARTGAVERTFELPEGEEATCAALCSPDLWVGTESGRLFRFRLG